MNTHQFSLNLRQHTPLIHFQWFEDGATLRASEIKPKLDRFILDKLGKLGTEHIDWAREQWKQENAGKDVQIFDALPVRGKGKYIAGRLGWLVGKGEHPALNYKIKVCADGVDNECYINEKKVDRHTGEYCIDPQRGIYKLNTYPLYLGNLDKNIEDDREYKRFAWTDNLIELTVFSFDSDLLQLLNGEVYRYTEWEKNLCFQIPGLMDEFFFHTNFGSRQSKGFGSFTVDRGEHVTLTNHPFRTTPFFRVTAKKQEKKEQWEELFSGIDLFYKFLRGGINQSGLYLKPFIFQYMKEYMGYNWEKRYIKEKYFNELLYGYRDRWGNVKEVDNLSWQKDKHKDQPDSPLLYDNKDYRLIRDLFGLSVSADWGSYNATIDKEDSVTAPQDEGKKDIITRFPSPLLFKVVKEKEKQTLRLVLPASKVVKEIEKVRETVYYVGILLNTDLIASFEKYLRGHKFIIQGKFKRGTCELNEQGILGEELKDLGLPDCRIAFPQQFSSEHPKMTFEEFWVDFFTRLNEMKEISLKVPEMKSTDLGRKLSRILKDYSYNKK